MILSSKEILNLFHTNIGGWQTAKKIVVIESDDWGSIRMPSILAYNYLLSKAIPVNKSIYCRFDALETSEDIYELMNVVVKYKDMYGNHPIFTLNTVVANPDFKKIEKSGFTEYFYEPFTETYKKYESCKESFTVLKQGIRNNLFHPQFHGREHVNVSYWLELLQKKEKAFIEGFLKNMWGLSNDVYTSKDRRSIQATYDYRMDAELPFLKNSISEGSGLFEDVFGFRSKSFMPNNFIWPSILDEDLLLNNIMFLQGMKYQILPSKNKKKRETIRRYTGIPNKSGIINIVRNCYYEPSENAISAENELSKCLKQIQTSFFWKKPAVISMHRINFIGSLSERNRTANLICLSALLKTILKQWPDVMFLSSDQLGELILADS